MVVGPYFKIIYNKAIVFGSVYDPCTLHLISLYYAVKRRTSLRRPGKQSPTSCLSYTNKTKETLLAIFWKRTVSYNYFFKHIFFSLFWGRKAAISKYDIIYLSGLWGKEGYIFHKILFLLTIFYRKPAYIPTYISDEKRGLYSIKYDIF